MGTTQTHHIRIALISNEDTTETFESRKLPLNPENKVSAKNESSNKDFFSSASSIKKKDLLWQAGEVHKCKILRLWGESQEEQEKQLKTEEQREKAKQRKQVMVMRRRGKG